MRRRSKGARTAPRLEALEVRQLLSLDLAAELPLARSLVVDRNAFDPGQILVRYRDVPGAPHGPATVAVPAGFDYGQVLRSFQDDPNVLYAEPNYRVQLTTTVPNDPMFGQQWALRNTTTPGADISATTAWDVTTGAGGTIVAVIDTGIQYTHPDLAANIWTNSGEIPGNGLDDDGNGYADDIHGYDFVNHDANPMDDHGHGTHVAGTIGAVGNNNTGVTGIAWNNVKLMALKFLDASGSGTVAGAIEALRYAVANGATISNNSWGGDEDSTALRDAIAEAGTHGHVFVAAAGNNGRNIDTAPAYPASYHLPNMLVVAASTSQDGLASFSNYGTSTVDLAAPGVGIRSTYKGSAYANMSGTSMATPHVAGAVAMLRGLHPDWTAAQVIDQIIATVDPTPAGAKTRSGGRLNLARALTAAPAPGPTSAVGFFDFGTSSSPLAAGYTRVTAATKYTVARGYGWITGHVEDRDRLIGDALTRDLSFTTDATFAVDLPNGDYTIQLTMHDPDYVHDQTAIYAEGALLEVIGTIPMRTVVRPSYTVSVHDGQLTLRIQDRGGSTPASVLNALVITPAGTGAASLGEAPSAVVAETAWPDAVIPSTPAPDPQRLAARWVRKARRVAVG